MKSLLYIALLLASSACMTKPNPAYRMDGEECSAATEATDCTEPNEPICGADNQCRGCAGDTECDTRDPNFPICVEGACLSRCSEGPAGDAACADRDDTKPYCVGEACVECRSDVDCTGGLACIEAAGRCEMCTAHSDCDTGACDRDSGTCVAEADIIYVDQNDAAANDAGTCESAAPCETIGGAIALIAETRTVIIVRGDETVFYDGVLTIDGIAATIIGSGANIQPRAGQMNTPVMTLSNGANLLIEGFTITLASGDTNADGVNCSGASTLRVHRVTVANNAATGIDADGCSVAITSSTLSSNDLGGISLRDSGFNINNNFIVNNGNIAVNQNGGVYIDNRNQTDQAVRVFSFNTVVGNQAKDTADAKGVRCRSDNPVTAIGNIVHGNLGNSPNLGGSCTWDYSNVEGGVPGAISGTGNIDMAPSFVDAAGGNFHLQPESPGVDVTGLTSDILVDFEGDLRPQNALFDMGADEVVPQ